MSTVIHFECRNTSHLASRSRGGVGGIVMHHGTFGYCDGSASDGDHRWIPTGGVFLEQLIRQDAEDQGGDAGFVPHTIENGGPQHLAL